MDRFFNTVGPIKTDLHHQIDPLTRLGWEEIQVLILQQKYFVLHAPRQTGKISTLLAAFQQFFRENTDFWLEHFDYKEAGPQLLMQAFLQRIINGGGRNDDRKEFSQHHEVTARTQDGCATGTFRTTNADAPTTSFNMTGRLHREYALGRKRTDIIIEWPTSDKGFHGDIQRIVIELKVLHGSLAQCIQKGVAQTADYAGRLGASASHLVIFNRQPQVSWDDKIWWKKERLQSNCIDIWGY